MTNRIILLLMLLCPTIIQAQTCEECKAKNYSYPYKFCDPTTGQYVTTCSKDPNAPGLKPWKLCPTSGYRYDASQLLINELFWSDNLSTTNYRLIFDKTVIPSIIQASYQAWTSICTPYPDPNCQSCPILVVWSSDIRDFRELANQPAKSQTIANGPNGANCRADCDATLIILNSTEEFMQRKKGSNAFPPNFFYTSAKAPIFLSPYDNYKSLDLRLILLHEMGHILGFDHTKSSCPENGESGGIGVMSDNPNKRSLELTEYDKCMYKTLYCCEHITDVQEEPATINSTFNIFPNPTSSSVTIALSPSTTQYVKRLRVVDITGKTVFEQVFPAGSSNCSVQTNELTKGSYLFVMTFEGINGSYAEKVIIQ